MDSFHVNIYLETSIRGPAIRPGAGMWLAEYIKSNGEPETRSGMVRSESITENRLCLMLMKEAFSILKKTCLVRVNTECGHVLNTIKNGHLSRWEKADWHNAKGKPVKNGDLWQQVYELMKNHGVTVTDEWHSYRVFMREKAGKEGEKPWQG